MRTPQFRGHTDTHRMDHDSDFQERVTAAQELRDTVRSTGQRLRITALGYIALNHATSEANRESILRDGRMTGNTWFAASKSMAEHHGRPKHGSGTVNIVIEVDPREVEFSTGTGEFYAPTGLVRDPTGLWRPPGAA